MRHRGPGYARRVQRVLDAIGAFGDYLASVELLPLAIGIGCHVAKTACTARAWRNVLAAAYPAARVRWFQVWAAYVSGVGVNAIVPARAGDVVRVVMAHRAVPESSYTTVVTSTAVLSPVDITLALLLFAYALTQGLLPSIDSLPDLPGFDFAWLFGNRRAAELLVVVAVLGVIVLSVLTRERWGDFRDRVGQAFAVFSPPARYVRTVVPWQLGDWMLRFTTIWFFLGAFGIDQTVRNVLLVQVSQSLATLLPISPGGIGTEQAFIVVVFRDVAAKSAVLAFSVGMRVTLTVVNVTLGFAAHPAHVRDGALPQRRRRRPPAGSRRRGSRLRPPAAARPCAAGRTRRGPSWRAGRARPRAPPVSPPGNALPSRSGCRIALRRTAPIPSSSSKIDSNARVSRRWRWCLMANRCASSRTRCRSCSPGSCRGRRTGAA